MQNSLIKYLIPILIFSCNEISFDKYNKENLEVKLIDSTICGNLIPSKKPQFKAPEVYYCSGKKEILHFSSNGRLIMIEDTNMKFQCLFNLDSMKDSCKVGKYLYLKYCQSCHNAKTTSIGPPLVPSLSTQKISLILKKYSLMSTHKIVKYPINELDLKTILVYLRENEIEVE